MSRPAVLFVCLGNICRSPLAEAALRAEAQRAGLDIEIDSAGTADWHVGRPPDPRAQAVALSKGLNIAHLRARQVCAEDFDRFTHIYALDYKVLASLRALAPSGARPEIALLLDCVSGREGEPVPDPYYGKDQIFEVTWDYVSAAAKEMVARLSESTICSGRASS